MTRLVKNRWYWDNIQVDYTNQVSGVTYKHHSWWALDCAGSSIDGGYSSKKQAVRMVAVQMARGLHEKEEIKGVLCDYARKSLDKVQLDEDSSGVFEVDFGRLYDSLQAYRDGFLDGSKVVKRRVRYELRGVLAEVE